MRVETGLYSCPMSRVAALAQQAEALGYDGLTCSEVRHEPFVVASVAAAATSRIQISTSIAIAFPRSPMVVAEATHNLQELSGGRFTLGLGTQVRGHVTRRFSSVWDSPGPRLREYVESLRAIWACFNGAPLKYEGQFYQFTLMTPEFNFGPTPHPLRIDLAAINRYNVETTALAANGLRLHGFNTAEYLRDTIWPIVHETVERAGRPLSEFEMIGGGFIASGTDEEAVMAAREQMRRRVAFYGSTRAYEPVLAHHGWQDLAPALRRLIAQGRWDELHTLVSDEVLDRFCMAGTYDTIADRVRERLGGLTDRVSLPMPEDGPVDDGLGRAIEALRKIPTAQEQMGAPVKG